MNYVKNSRMLALLGQRGTFGAVLCELASEDERIMAITADLTRTSGLERFSRDFPERFLNVGIAEQNALGVAAGLADEGRIPFVTTFANFAALRANEFVRHFMAYMNCNIKLVGLGSGFSMELFGTTHYGLEDVGVLRPMPNLTILSPSDCLETAKCVEYAARHKGPVYLRLSGKMNQPAVNRKDYEFCAKKAVQLTWGGDVVIYTTGSMTSVCLDAAEELKREGCAVSVIHMHTIKPIDEEIIVQNKDCGLIVTVEEHAREGGLGSAVAEVLAGWPRHGRLIRLGTADQYQKAGSYEYMLEQHGLTAEKIAEKISGIMRGAM